MLLAHLSPIFQKDRKYVEKSVRIDGLNLQHAPDFASDNSIVYRAVTENGDAIQYSSFCDNEFVAATAIKERSAVDFLSDRLKKDRDFILKVISLHPDMLKTLDETFRDCKRLVLIALKKNGLLIKYVSNRLISDPEVISFALKQNGEALYYVIDKTKKYVLMAVKTTGDAIRFASDKFKDDFRIAFVAVKQSWSAYRYISTRLKNNMEIVREAMKQDALVFNDFPDDLKCDKDLIIEAVSKYAWLYQTINLLFKADTDVIMAMIQNDGKGLKYVEEVFITENMIQTAVKQDGAAIKYVSDQFITMDLMKTAINSNSKAIACIPQFHLNEEIILYAFERNKYAFMHVPCRLHTDSLHKKLSKRMTGSGNMLEIFRYSRSLVKSLIEDCDRNPIEEKETMISYCKSCGRLLELMSDKMKNNRIVVSAAVSNDGNAIQYASKRLQNDKSVATLAITTTPASYEIMTDKIKNDVFISLFAILSDVNIIELVPDSVKKNIEFGKLVLCDEAVDHILNPTEKPFDVCNEIVKKYASNNKS